MFEGKTRSTESVRMVPSLSRAMMLASVGLAQLVPSTVSNWPSTTISTFVPMAETSGYARPEALNLPLFVEPWEARYEETTDALYEGVPK